MHLLKADLKRFRRDVRLIYVVASDFQVNAIYDAEQKGLLGTPDETRHLVGAFSSLDVCLIALREREFILNADRLLITLTRF
jgi:hypothetical protein